MAEDSVLIPRGSRYKDTRAFRGARGPEFEMFSVPSEFETLPDNSQRYTVKQHEIGFLDAIASEVYGEGMESFWWIIALANDMIDPEKEMRAGDILVIPPISLVQEFISRSESNA